MKLVEHTDGVDLDVEFRFRADGSIDFHAGPAPVPCIACLKQMPGYFMYCGGSRYGHLADVECPHCSIVTRISDSDIDRNRISFALIGHPSVRDSEFWPYGETLLLDLRLAYLLVPEAFRAVQARHADRLDVGEHYGAIHRLSSFVTRARASFGASVVLPLRPVCPVVARVPPVVEAWRLLVHSCSGVRGLR
jgi:hypothetical protein